MNKSLIGIIIVLIIVILVALVNWQQESLTHHTDPYSVTKIMPKPAVVFKDKIYKVDPPVDKDGYRKARLKWGSLSDYYNMMPKNVKDTKFTDMGTKFIDMDQTGESDGFIQEDLVYDKFDAVKHIQTKPKTAKDMNFHSWIREDDMVKMGSNIDYNGELIEPEFNL